MGVHGEEILTYGSKVSLISNGMIFIINFCYALTYCQVFVSSGCSLIFITPALLQLVILFFQIKLIGYQLRVLSIDRYPNDQ